MFTGIVRDLGEVKSIEEVKGNLCFEFRAGSVLENKKIGDSIAVNGVCLTVLEVGDKSFKAEVMPETLRKTNLGFLKVGDEVNLESSLVVGQSMDGHFVLGHVDGFGEVVAILEDGNSRVLSISFPENLVGFLAYKGSVCLNGVSLTISGLEENKLSVSLIPHTLESTNLGRLKKGDKLNMEVDVLARYLGGLLKAKDGEAKYEWLVERGFI